MASAPSFLISLLEQITQEAFSARDRGFHGSHWLVQQFRDFVVVHGLEIVAGKTNTIALSPAGNHDFKFLPVLLLFNQCLWTLVLALFHSQQLAFLTEIERDHVHTSSACMEAKDIQGDPVQPGS